jgi:hypothetical protein
MAALRMASDQPRAEVGGDSLCRPAIPELGDPTALAGTGQNLVNTPANRCPDLQPTRVLVPARR